MSPLTSHATGTVPAVTQNPARFIQPCQTTDAHFITSKGSTEELQYTSLTDGETSPFSQIAQVHPLQAMQSLWRERHHLDLLFGLDDHGVHDSLTAPL